MYVTCKKSTADFKLTENLAISPDTSTVYGELCWLTGLQNQEASGLKQRMMSVTESLVPSVATRILIGIYKFRTADKTLSPLSIFVSGKPWQLLAEPTLRNTGLDRWLGLVGIGI
jgi:hypothetical protein